MNRVTMPSTRMEARPAFEPKGLDSYLFDLGAIVVTLWRNQFGIVGAGLVAAVLAGSVRVSLDSV